MASKTLSPAKKIRLRLYVAGHGPNSLAAVTNLQEICGRYAPQRFQIEIVDVLDSPMEALRDKVIATPTLMRIAPAPAVRVFGDLSDKAALLTVLGLGAEAK